MSRDYIFTSESVSEGHPDKVCDQISDSILDFYLQCDPNARVAAEVMATTNRVVIAGEVRARLHEDQDNTNRLIEQHIRKTVRQIGYEQDGFHWENLEVTNLLHAQSSDIAIGVDADGAGDQGIMFGFACNETEEFMPAPISYAHRILKNLSQLRHAGDNRLQPDAKSQVSLVYRDGKPIGVDTVLVSSQHQEGVSQEVLKEIIAAEVRKVLPKEWDMPKKLYVNPTGNFVIGGPDGDAGLTGRKIIVDTYGGAAVHGGGAFSGKDATKVDRSAAYMGRYLAKNIVAAGLAERCTIQICYAIGMAQPLALYVNQHGTGKVAENLIEDWLMKEIDLSPKGIITRFDLTRPKYLPTASYGHFGRSVGEEGSFDWERLDLISGLQKEFI